MGKDFDLKAWLNDDSWEQHYDYTQYLDNFLVKNFSLELNNLAYVVNSEIREKVKKGKISDAYKWSNHVLEIIIKQLTGESINSTTVPHDNQYTLEAIRLFSLCSYHQSLHCFDLGYIDLGESYSYVVLSTAPIGREAYQKLYEEIQDTFKMVGLKINTDNKYYDSSNGDPKSCINYLVDYKRDLLSLINSYPRIQLPKRNAEYVFDIKDAVSAYEQAYHLHYNEGKLDEAKALYTIIIDKFPISPAARLSIKQLKRIRKEEQFSNDELNHTKYNFEVKDAVSAYKQAYHLHYNEGKLDEAKTLYEVIVAKFPTSKEAGYSNSQIQNIAQEEVERKIIVERNETKSTYINSNINQGHTNTSSNERSRISPFWIVIMIIGALITLTGAGAIVGVPMLGIAIFYSGLHGGTGNKTMGCIGVGSVIGFIAFIIIAVLLSAIGGW